MATTKRLVTRNSLAAAMGGASFAALLLASLTSLEGNSNVGYLDIAGIPTACTGDTVNVVVGKFYSDAECHARLVRQATAHIKDVQRCTPGLTGYQLVAAGLLTYNIGGAHYCSSTAARRFKAGDRRGGCDAFKLFNRAGGRVVRGLVNRRAFETEICLRGVA